MSSLVLSLSIAAPFAYVLIGYLVLRWHFAVNPLGYYKNRKPRYGRDPGWITSCWMLWPLTLVCTVLMVVGHILQEIPVGKIMDSLEPKEKV